MIEYLTIEKCIKGDKRAQRNLYSAYAKKMFVHCYRYLKNKEDAEDILSIGFVKVFDKLSKVEYRDAKSFEGWVRRIMVNECLMFLRKQKRISYLEVENITLETEPHVSEELEAKDIFNHILSLPIGYRTIFNLYSIEGYSHKEIAEQLAINESTSRSQLFKARTMLKRLLSNN